MFTKMERKCMMITCTLRQPCVLYRTSSKSTQYQQLVRFASSKGKSRAKLIGSPKMKLPRDSIPKPLEKPKMADVKPLPYRAQEKRPANPITTLQSKSRTPPMSPIADAASASTSPVQHPASNQPYVHQVEKHLSIPDYVIYPGDTQTMPLPDGRGVLGYAVFGSQSKDTNRIPLVVYPGTPYTRLSCHDLHKWAEARGIPVIVPERPGCGISTYRRNGTIADHAQDVRNLMHHLGYRRYRVMGISGGGPFALAHAAITPASEVLVTGIMCGVSPPEANRSGQTLARQIREILTRLFPELRLWHLYSQNRIFFRKLMSQKLPPPDTSEGKQALAHRAQYAKENQRGYIADFRAYNRYWGFELEDMTHTSPILMYAGTMDESTPISGARYMNRRIPNCELREKAGCDHSSVQAYTWELLNRMMK